MAIINAATGEIVARSLDELEAVIERGIETFKEVGIALSEIRDARLYKQTHATFDDYCNDRWGFDRRRASAIMIAAEVSEISDIPVSNEAHASALAPLRDDPDKLNAALEQAVADAERDGAKLTADRIRKAVDRITKPSPDVPEDLPSCGSASGEPTSEGAEVPAKETSRCGVGQSLNPPDPPSDPIDVDPAAATVVEFLKSIAKAYDAIKFDPELLADANNPDVIAEIDEFARGFGAWRQRFTENLPRLQVVSNESH